MGSGASDHERHARVAELEVPGPSALPVVASDHVLGGERSHVCSRRWFEATAVRGTGLRFGIAVSARR